MRPSYVIDRLYAGRSWSPRFQCVVEVDSNILLLSGQLVPRNENLLVYCGVWKSLKVDKFFTLRGVVPNGRRYGSQNGLLLRYFYRAVLGGI